MYRANWPERVIELTRLWKVSEDPVERRAKIAEIWQLLHTAVGSYILRHARTGSGIAPDDAFDVASEKTLGLARQLVIGDWDPSQSHPGQLCSLISTLARNGLIDHWRRHRRDLLNLDDVEEARGAEPGDAPDRTIENQRFADALRSCSYELQPRVRLAWFLRVFHELSSKEIGCNPIVGMKPSAIDVALARTRQKIRECMESKGFEPNDLRPGAFTTLWLTFRKELRGGYRNDSHQ